MIKKFVFILGLLPSLILSSCSNLNTAQVTKLDNQITSNLGVYQTYNIDLSELNKNNPKTGVSASFIINSNSNFKIKETKSAIAPKTQADVKSYDIFLTNNPTNPFASGANIFGDGIKFQVDNTSLNPIVVTMYNLPVGEHYYLAIAAFDDIIKNTATRKNITKINSFIDSSVEEEKKWAVSSNCLTVASDYTLTYSGDGSTMFEVYIKLDDGVANEIDTKININSGVDVGELSVI